MVPSNANYQRTGGSNGFPNQGTYLLSHTHSRTDLTQPVPPIQQRMPLANTLGPSGTSSSSSISRCTNCHLFHLRGRPCPNLTTEVHIRLALDDVKALSGGDIEKTRQNRAILQNILRVNLFSRPPEKGGPPVQTAPLQSQHEQPPQQQARLAAPQQHFEKESSESDEDESSSEESSEYDSDEGPGLSSV